MKWNMKEQEEFLLFTLYEENVKCTEQSVWRDEMQSSFTILREVQDTNKKIKVRKSECLSYRIKSIPLNFFHDWLTCL